MTPDRRFDDTFSRRDAGDHRQILPMDAAGLQLASQVGVRLERLRHHEQPAGVLVETMHDARARHGCYGRSVI
jgi:hypothetical protein